MFYRWDGHCSSVIFFLYALRLSRVRGGRSGVYVFVSLLVFSSVFSWPFTLKTARPHTHLHTHMQAYINSSATLHSLSLADGVIVIVILHSYEESAVYIYIYIHMLFIIILFFELISFFSPFLYKQLFLCTHTHTPLVRWICQFLFVCLERGKKTLLSSLTLFPFLVSSKYQTFGGSLPPRASLFLLLVPSNALFVSATRVKEKPQVLFPYCLQKFPVHQ